MEQVLTFTLGNMLYGLEITSVQEVFEPAALFPIPRAPSFFKGALNFHGTILPVLALADYMGIESPHRDHRVIVLSPKICHLALEVTGVRRIVHVESEALRTSSPEESKDLFVRSFLEQEESLRLLDLTALIQNLKKRI